MFEADLIKHNNSNLQMAGILKSDASLSQQSSKSVAKSISQETNLHKVTQSRALHDSINDTMRLLDGLRIESRTRQLCCHILLRDKTEFFKQLIVSTQKPLVVVAETIRQLKLNLREQGRIILIGRKAGASLVKHLEFDWEVYASILRN